MSDIANPHTRVPNLLVDLVYPLLSPAEVRCLQYIVRRTHGFVDPGGGYKTHDRISITQFEEGIRTGAYVLDLGTGLSRNSILSALKSLLAKELVDAQVFCSRCLWEDANMQAANAKAPRCPRCQRTCDRRYGLVPLTPNLMIRFLNTHDPRKRTWTFDRDVMRFQVKEAGGVDIRTTSSPAPAGLPEDYVLWYPELVDQVVDQLQSTMRSGRRISEDEKTRKVLHPVLELQSLATHHPAALKFALEETLRRKTPSQRRAVPGKNGETSYLTNWGWHRYTRAILQRHIADARSRPAGAAPTNDEASMSMEAREDAVCALLARACTLNEYGDYESARALLSDILAQVPHLAPAFEGNKDTVDGLLRLAFKRGATDFRTVAQITSPYDFYPEWNPPPDLGDTP